jgi:hypothetical protein
MSEPKTLDRDHRGPNEPSYRPVGLRWVYWSDLGSEERQEFRREREPTVAEVQEWLRGQGFTVVPVEEGEPPAR